MHDAVSEAKLLRAARRGDRGARDRLVVAHLGLVREVAARYRGAGLPFDDLVQEGSLGLLEAIDRYDPYRGAEFASFARFRVRRAIRNALTEQARLIRLPKHVVERRRIVARAEERLAAGGSRTPTDAELAAATGLSETAVREARGAASPPASLDEAATVGGPPLETLVADAFARDPEREALASERVRLVREAARRLPPRQRHVVARRFGLGGAPAEVAAVAVDLHLSERRTRTIEHDALHELREALELAGAAQ